MRYRKQLALLFAMLTLASLVIARAPLPPQQKEYLTDSEADKIRDADTPALRIKLYISFAEDRLKKFEYEIHRTVPERRRAEILNALLNGYSGCIDDAADQIDVAQEKQQDIREALKMMRAKNKEFLETLQKYDKDGPELDTYRDTLEDAIEGTKDALTDIDDAEKEATPGPVRRKPS
jgi:predicted RNase H-like nuclease (RuvC/YqgF family)